MQLSAALGSVLVYTNLGPAARDAWVTALRIADELGDLDFQLRSLWGLWVDSLNNGSFRDALVLARQFHEAASGSTNHTDAHLGDRMIGITLHFLGNQIDARRHIEQMLSRYVAPVSASHIIRFQFDQRLTARAFQARCLWQLGFPDQALRLVDRTVEEARSTGHVLTLCNVLGQGACPVAFWSGDLDAVERYLQLLLSWSESHTLSLWHAWGLCFHGLLLVKRGDTAAGLGALHSVRAEVPEIRSLPRYLGLLGELALAMGQSGEIDEALATVDGAIERSRLREERWCLAELLRVKGDLVQKQDLPDLLPSASTYFREAIDLAREQSALGWELRAAISFARLRHRQGAASEAHGLLAAVYGRFTEGFETPDLKTARQLLDEFG
jgi:predicted ATPase